MQNKYKIKVIDILLILVINELHLVLAEDNLQVPENQDIQFQVSPRMIPTEAIVIGEETEPDAELVGNPCIASTTEAMGVCSFIDARQPY